MGIRRLIPLFLVALTITLISCGTGTGSTQAMIIEDQTSVDTLTYGQRIAFF